MATGSTGGGSSVTELLVPTGTGELVGTATELQGPDIACKGVMFKATASNTGNVYIGLATGVTVPAGTTNTTAGWELSAREETGYLPCLNLNQFWRICTSAADDLVYVYWT